MSKVRTAVSIALLFLTGCTSISSQLVGTWKEDVQLDCNTLDEIRPSDMIRELEFRADGTFAVTWQPFEVYHDYSGTYLYDSKSRSLTLNPTTSNYMPSPTDFSGTAEIDAQGRLVLYDMWLGAPPGATSIKPNCGHRFVQ
jgi:hypothetical protein